LLIRAVRTTKLRQLDFGQDAVIEKSAACLQEVVKVITELQESPTVMLAIEGSDFEADLQPAAAVLVHRASGEGLTAAASGSSRVPAFRTDPVAYLGLKTEQLGFTGLAGAAREA
jgi:hypothetical protein